MKAILTNHIINFGITLRPIAVALFMLLLLGITSLIVVRQHCIKEGYEISKLASQLEQKNIEYQKVHERYSDALRDEKLIKEALSLGFEFPSGDRVFYVQ